MFRTSSTFCPSSLSPKTASRCFQISKKSFTFRLTMRCNARWITVAVACAQHIARSFWFVGLALLFAFRTYTSREVSPIIPASASELVPKVRDAVVNSSMIMGSFAWMKSLHWPEVGNVQPRLRSAWTGAESEEAVLAILNMLCAAMDHF